MTIATFHSDDPAELRRQAVERLAEATGASRGLYYEVRELDGRKFYANLTTVGPPRFRELVDQLDGRELLDGASATISRGANAAREGRWSVYNPRRDHRNRFCLLRDDLDLDRLRRLPAWKKFYVRGGFTTDQLKAFCYDSGTFVGWVGVFRGDEESRFDVVHRAIANRQRDSIREAVLAANALEAQAELPSGYVLFNARGKRLFATENARGLPDRLIDRARILVRDADRGRPVDDVTVCGRIGMRLMRMDGPDGVMYLGRLAPVRRPRQRLEEVLTPRQLEVAELAANGATVKIIADALEVRPTTVKYHLREIYKRLDIATRAELAAIWVDSDQRRSRKD